MFRVLRSILICETQWSKQEEHRQSCNNSRLETRDSIVIQAPEHQHFRRNFRRHRDVGGTCSLHSVYHSSIEFVKRNERNCRWLLCWGTAITKDCQKQARIKINYEHFSLAVIVLHSIVSSPITTPSLNIHKSPVTQYNSGENVEAFVHSSLSLQPDDCSETKKIVLANFQEEF